MTKMVRLNRDGEAVIEIISPNTTDWEMYAEKTRATSFLAVVENELAEYSKNISETVIVVKQLSDSTYKFITLRVVKDDEEDSTFVASSYDVISSFEGIVDYLPFKKRK